MRPTLALAVVAACGSSSPVDQLCDGSGLWTQWQYAAAQCVADASKNALYTMAYMEQNCRATLQPMFDRGVVAIGTADTLAMCRKALAANTCDPALYKDWAAATAICNDLVEGNIIPGAPCSVDEECAGSSTCEISGACGVCAAKRGEGAACSGNHQCGSGLCSGGKCLATNVPEHSLCSVTDQCAAGLICRDHGYCESLAGALGSTCSSDADCGYYQASCLGGTCVALATTSQACTGWAATPVTHPHCRWFEGDGCLGGVCTPVPTAAAGQACGVDVAVCAGGSYCGSTNKCITIVAPGGFCTGSADCGPYGVCLSDHTCTFSDFNAVCEPSTGGGLGG